MRGIVHQRRRLSAATGVHVDREAAVAMPAMQRTDSLVRQPAGRLVAAAARPLPALQGADLGPLSARSSCSWRRLFLAVALVSAARAKPFAPRRVLGHWLDWARPVPDHRGARGAFADRSRLPDPSGRDHEARDRAGPVLAFLAPGIQPTSGDRRVVDRRSPLEDRFGLGVSGLRRTCWRSFTGSSGRRRRGSCSGRSGRSGARPFGSPPWASAT